MPFFFSFSDDFLQDAYIIFSKNVDHFDDSAQNMLNLV